MINISNIKISSNYALLKQIHMNSKSYTLENVVLNPLGELKTVHTLFVLFFNTGYLC